MTQFINKSPGAIAPYKVYPHGVKTRAMSSYRPLYVINASTGSIRARPNWAPCQIATDGKCESPYVVTVNGDNLQCLLSANKGSRLTGVVTLR